MRLESVLRPECVLARRSFRTKEEAIEEVARLASHSPVLHKFETDMVHMAIRDREAQASTGFEQGIAIPHCSLENLDSFVVGAITVEDELDFRSLDDKPARLIFFIVGPKSQRTRHVKLLSALSRLSRNPKLVDELVAIDSNEELRRRILEEVEYDEDEPDRALSLLHVYIQNDEFFESVLEVLTSYTEGMLLVQELKAPSHYLHRLPLFATLWGDENEQAVRYVQAIAKTSNCNDLVRKISLIPGEPLGTPGIMIAVQDLQYVTGGLEL
jgi:nitrogen PTS system EIIA component